MNTRKKRKAITMDEEGIDRLVVAQARDESAWKASIRVKRSKPAAPALRGEMAALLARLHRESGI
jgi:hypothetical protein